MTPADFEKGNIALTEAGKPAADEKWHEHPLDRSLHENRGIGEKQVAVLRL